MRRLKATFLFFCFVSLQIAAAQWLNVPPPVEAKNLMVFTAGVPVAAGPTAKTFVNADAAYAASGTSIASAALAQTTGNLMVVWTHVSGDYNVTGVSDTVNSYTQVVARVNPTGGYRNECWIAKNITGAASRAVTVTYDSSGADLAVLVAQYSGASTSAPHDTGYTPSATTDNATPYTSSSDSTAEDNELIVALIYNTVADTTYSNGTGTIRANELNVWVIADKNAATAGAHTIDVAGNSGEAHVVLAVAFK